jgi:hypothetical protein
MSKMCPKAEISFTKAATVSDEVGKKKKAFVVGGGGPFLYETILPNSEAKMYFDIDIKKTELPVDQLPRFLDSFLEKLNSVLESPSFVTSFRATRLNTHSCFKE